MDARGSENLTVRLKLYREDVSSVFVSAESFQSTNIEMEKWVNKKGIKKQHE